MKAYKHIEDEVTGEVTLQEIEVLVEYEEVVEPTTDEILNAMLGVTE